MRVIHSPTDSSPNRWCIRLTDCQRDAVRALLEAQGEVGPSLSGALEALDLARWDEIQTEHARLAHVTTLLEGSQALTHRLVKLPGVSRRRRRLLGPLQSRLYDV